MLNQKYLFFFIVIIITLTANVSQAQRVDIQAVLGNPFGVGRIVIQADDAAFAKHSGIDAIEIIEKDNRILYPAFATGLLRNALRQVLNIKGRATVYFLYKGNGPLQITVKTPAPIVRRVVPIAGRRVFTRNMHTNWWRQYTQSAAMAIKSGNRPSVADHYLISMLAKRLRLDPSIAGDELFSKDSPSMIDVLSGNESLKIAMLNQIMSTTDGKQSADSPLPKAVALEPLKFPQHEKVIVEPIANHVPAECFYLRMGSFANYLWMRGVLEDLGGDVSQMISARGVNYHLSKKMEQQLGIHDSALSKLLGDTLIADVAIIGTDTFLREGASIGILFQAKNNILLSTNLNMQRSDSMKKVPQAKKESIKIKGVQVSAITSPDHSIRSFYVQDGDYHLVTTSRAMVRRFLEAGKGFRALGKSAEFQHVRHLMPIKNDYSIFGYFSDVFFQNLVSPRYQIEMSRRLRSTVEIQIQTLARLAAKNEGKAADSIEQLIAGGFLPKSFGRRYDGSKMNFTKTGIPTDSLRGKIGQFLPIGDVAVGKVTELEIRQYAKFAQQYGSSSAIRMNPIIFGLKRSKKDKQGVEKLTIEAKISPFTGKGYQNAVDYLGSPTKKRIAPISNNLISIDAVLKKSDGVKQYFAAGALADYPFPVDVEKGTYWELLTKLPRPYGYVTTWPEVGPVLKFLGISQKSKPADSNYSKRPGFLIFPTIYIHWMKNFTIVALQQTELDRVGRDLKMAEAKMPAQIRFAMKDLVGTNIEPVIQKLWYRRATEVSHNNAVYFHHLSRQYGLNRKEVLRFAEDLSGLEYVCSLGGKYQFSSSGNNASSWISSAWFDKNRSRVNRMPKSYQAPILQWIRGANLHVAVDKNILKLEGTISLQRTKPLDFNFPDSTKK